VRWFGAVTDDDTDDRLLERARAGDSTALERLLARHQGRVYRFGMKMCGNPEDAKDVLQETLLAMARGVRDFRGASSVSTWLYTIARSFCIKKRRRSQFAPAHEHSLETDARREAASLPDTGQRPDEAASTRQLERALEGAIGALEPASREVLLLRDVEGLSAPEVAEVLGLGVQAVKSRLHRARLAVRERVAPLLGIPDATSQPASSCPDVLDLFSRHLEGEVSAEVCAAMERHLEDCGRCRGACDSLKRTLGLCRTAGIPAGVPAPVQAAVKVALEDFLAGRA
jgi:RNA polymerase sigma-70 factor, ECF subfamily